MHTFQDALSSYLARGQATEADLAAKVGHSQAAINRYRNGKRFPDADTARLIDKHTNGEVPFALWQSDFLSRSGISGHVRNAKQASAA